MDNRLKIGYGKPSNICKHKRTARLGYSINSSSPLLNWFQFYPPILYKSWYRTSADICHTQALKRKQCRLYRAMAPRTVQSFIGNTSFVNSKIQKHNSQLSICFRYNRINAKAMHIKAIVRHTNTTISR